MTDRSPHPPRDLRRYATSTTARLILGGVVLILVVGVALVNGIYGRSAAVGALACVGIGLSPVVLIVLYLAALDWLKRRGDRD